MTDQSQEYLKNPVLRLAEEIAEARLKRAGVKLGDDWGLQPAKPATEHVFPPELIRKIAGG
jgi:hypothetical protein